MSRPLKELLVEIDALKKEVDAVRPLKPEQEQRIMQKFRLDWNFHSNAIEGNKLSQGETRVFLLEGLTAHGKPLKDHLDIRGHDEVISWLLDFIRRKAELSEADIRGLHKVLLVEPYQVEAVTTDGKKTQKWIKLGEYKSEPNQVTTPTGATRIFALPEDTPAKMGELVAWYRRQMGGEQIHPLITSALVHHQFVAIHPFDDGNGRMARILMNLILMQYGFPPVVIRTDEKDTYYFVLGKADAGETEEFVCFIAEKLIASLQLYLRGARGESIDEMDDIDKKVALFKQQFQHLPDPIRYSPEISDQFVVGPIRQLLAKAMKKLSMFDDLFFDRSLFYSVNDTVDSEATDVLSLSQIEKLLLSRTIAACWFAFSWRSFRKAPENSIKVSVQVSFKFDEFEYHVTGVGSGITRPYSEFLKEEDCDRLVKEMAETVFQSIQTQSGQKK